MTEAPIGPPPNWKPAPPTRETMSAGVVRQFKEDVWNANELIRYWAGRNDKPAYARPSADNHVSAFLGALDRLKSMSRLQDTRIAEFRAFGVVWNNGAGSWTQCKPMIAKLNSDLMDLDP
jgi:hypothetical protein